MNAAFVGDRNVAPRAHPGDGVIDEVTLALPVKDRLRAWKRMVSGQHVPHPGISIRRRSEGRVCFDRALPVSVDGVACGRTRSITYQVLPSALLVAV